MIETMGAIAFAIAIILMCGPQACYNAGSWVGLILMAFWKIAAWIFRTIAKVVQNLKPAPVLLPAASLNVVSEPISASSTDNVIDAHVIEGKATVL